MSIDYYANIAVGFEVESRTLPKQQVPGTSHTEHRYDSKTGNLLPDEVVLDERPHLVIISGGKQYGDFREFCSDLVEEIGCVAHFSDSDEFESRTDGRAIFGPTLEEQNDGQDPHPHFSVGGSIDYEAVVRSAAEVERIGRELRARGIAVGRPVVALVCGFG